jgi:hypothetical protein
MVLNWRLGEPNFKLIKAQPAKVLQQQVGVSTLIRI